jgi:hypothetical protein
MAGAGFGISTETDLFLPRRFGLFVISGQPVPTKDNRTMPRPAITRRRLLKAAGVTVALPLLEVTAPLARADAPALPRRRIVAILYPLSFYPPNFFPEQPGRDYTATRYLKFIDEYRNEFTVYSGLSHPRVAQTHFESENVFLTGSPVIGSTGNAAAFRNTVSLDQLAAAKIGSVTRFPTLNVGNLSFLPSGGKVPGMTKPSEFFAKLFLSGSEEQKQAQKRRLQNGQSILDLVGDQAREMKRGLPTRDGERLDEYFSSVRDAEKRLSTMLEWEDKPKPKSDQAAPRDVSQRDKPFEFLRLVYDLIVLALKHDASRLITVHAGFMGTQPTLGNSSVDYHNLSHHGKLPDNLDKLCKLEDESMKAFAEFIKKMTGTKEEGESMLNRTMVLLGSNLGNSNTHETTNLPIILAGGGFKHGEYVAFDRANNTPLCNLYVSMLQRLGLDINSFGSSKGGALKGLEVAGS